MIGKIGKGYENKIFKNALKMAKKSIALENKYESMSDSELIDSHNDIYDRKTGKKDIPEAMAIFREVSFRTNGLKPYEVQMLASCVLFNGTVAEMKTGEGKTLVALIASYLSLVIDNQKTHVITVNDYLAKRDAEFAKKTFDFLNVKVGFLSGDNNNNFEKTQIYNESSIIYASNTTLGFDYLRSNIAKKWDDKIIKDIDDCFVIVDEVDSVLIDEAKSPLIISGESEMSDVDTYKKIFEIAKEMSGKVINKDESNKTSLQKMTGEDEEEFKDFDYVADRRNSNTHLNEKGYETFENKCLEYGLISDINEIYREKISFSHILHMCLSAISIYKKGVDYIVSPNSEGKNSIKLIDMGTGRIMEGKMMSNGLHQAIEIKEGLDVSTESKTLAEIAYQNLFKLYGKMSGMTGTAYEDKKELEEIYGLSVCKIPTRKPVIRKEFNDVLFPDKETKIKHTINRIIEIHKTGQPILVGTNSVNDSEEISHRLNDLGYKCEVLNAKNHTRESYIIAQAGRLGAITIATSMAGRGTDIILGGTLSDRIASSPDDADLDLIKKDHIEEQEKVKEIGGLFVLGFERNRSRRVDDQIKGRSGRQGDPGASCFYLSFEDDLLTMFSKGNIISRAKDYIFGSAEYVTGVKMLDNAVLKSQRSASRSDFDQRLSLLKFDNVIDRQRRKFYSLRDSILKINGDYIDINDGSYKSDMIDPLEREINLNLNDLCDKYNYMVEDDYGIEKEVKEVIGIDLDKVTLEKYISSGKSKGSALFDTIIDQINYLKDDMSNFTFYSLLRVEKINTLDEMWIDQLEFSSEAKRAVQLRSYAQKKPDEEYKKETWTRFNNNILNLSTFESLRKVLSYT